MKLFFYLCGILPPLEFDVSSEKFKIILNVKNFKENEFYYFY